MSHGDLLEVEASRALEATRRFEELAFFHVPFDELNSDSRTEATLARLIGSGGRVAVIGPSGSGKSSLIAAVLGPLSEAVPPQIVPLRVPVATEADETVTEPGEMAKHLVRYVTRWASPERFSKDEVAEFEKGVAEIRRRAGGSKTREYHLGLPFWLANAEFSRQVQATGEQYEERPSASDSIEHLKRMLALFHSHGLTAAFVFDDADTWLRIPGLDRTQVANAFFTRTVRMLSKELDSCVVMAVHDEYLHLGGYQSARGLLSGDVHIPRLIDPLEGLDRILRDRLVIAELSIGLDDIIERDTVNHLAKYYKEGRTLRDVLRATQRCLQHALSDGMELLTPRLVDQAITELAQ